MSGSTVKSGIIINAYSNQHWMKSGVVLSPKLTIDNARSSIQDSRKVQIANKIRLVLVLGFLSLTVLSTGKLLEIQLEQSDYQSFLLVK